jgi:hypothetical protein
MIRFLSYVLLWLPLVALTVSKMIRALDADRNREAALCAPVLFALGLVVVFDVLIALENRKGGAK